MEDREIVALYWRRDERAITETDRKYGGLCRAIAMNLLGVREDAEECVNDTWLQAWNSMPEQRPERLRAWLGRVVRNLSISRWRAAHRQKRYAGIELLLSELDECVPDPSAGPENAAEAKEIGLAVDRWLRSLDEEDRRLFLRRYWYGDALNRLAEASGEDAARLAQRMFRLRKKLKAALEKEGIGL